MEVVAPSQKLGKIERDIKPDKLIVPFQAIVCAGMRGAETAALQVADAARIRVGGWSYDLCPNKPHGAELAPGGTWTSAVAHNVRDSDGTLVFTFSQPNGPTRVALARASKRGKPNLHIMLRPRGVVSPPAISAMRRWFTEHAIKVVHITGSRHETDPGIEQAVVDVLVAILEAE